MSCKDFSCTNYQITIGLDIGIASVGWAVLSTYREVDGVRNGKILDLGVRIFEAAEDERGKPLNIGRREARLTRRRLTRRARRLINLRNILHDAGLSITNEIFAVLPNKKDPWVLRAEGLDRILSPEEWVRTLYHLVKHRGFYVARKSEELEENKLNDGDLLKGIKRTQNLIEERGYRSAGEMVVVDVNFKEAKRNKYGDYKNTFHRKLLREELGLLFKKQEEFGNSYASKVLHKKVDDIFWSQKKALSGEKMLEMIGKCTLEPTEYRAPKSSWKAERFIWLTKLNNLRIIQDGVSRQLKPDERKVLIDIPYKNTDVKYSTIRKLLTSLQLGFDQNTLFKGLNYSKKFTQAEADEGLKKVENKKLFCAKAFHDLRKLYCTYNLQDEWKKLSTDEEKMDGIASCLSICKSDEELRDALMAINCTIREIDALLNISFSGFIRLSIKALKNILPLMEKGLRYDEACEDFGYRYNQQNNGGDRRFLPSFNEDNIKNPVVLRSIRQSKKVVNAIIKKYGSPYAIHVELARDLSKSLKERKKIREGQNDFAVLKARLLEEFKDQFPMVGAPKSIDLLKYRLYKEQDCICAYSNKPIELERLTEDGYVQIDHILPYSRSFDDSLHNKVLVFTRENQNKGKKTPYEYLDGKNNNEKWCNFEFWVKNNKKIKQPKKDRLLRKEFDNDFEKQDSFASRNLNDTRYITKIFAGYLRGHLRFSDPNNKVPILTPSGGFTSFLRTRWGFEKNREISDLHHAMDACVIATASHSLIRSVSEYNKSKEILSRKNWSFPKPWPEFRNELLDRLSGNSEQQIWVSRAPKRLKRGSAHEAIIRSAKYLNKGKSSQRIKLSEIKLTHFEAYNKNGLLNNETIVGLEDPRNRNFIQLLKERLEVFKGDAKEAFAEPFYKPLVDGSNGPIVRTVKVFKAQNSYVAVRSGVADRDRMWRVDVFEKKEAFYCVPIYLDQICKRDSVLPNKAVVSGKKYDDWVTIDETFNFYFSLHHNDCVSLKTKKAEYIGYFAGLDIATAAINIRSHDNRELWRSLGVKRGVITFRKFHVDVLGNKYSVTSEKRCGLA